MKAIDIINKLESLYPVSIQEEWDHSGLQCGDINRDIKKVMISLDADLRTLDEVIDKKCDMWISHHPFLFNPLTLDFNTPVGKFIKKAITYNIVIYSIHTPLDKVSMNEWLIHVLDVHYITTIEESGIVRYGEFSEPIESDDFISLVKEKFHVDHVRTAGASRAVKKIAVCGGSGASFIEEVAPLVDAYITGDLKYHDGQKAYEQDVFLVDVGHHVEVIMVDELAKVLSDLDVEIVKSVSPDYYSFR